LISVSILLYEFKQTSLIKFEGFLKTIMLKTNGCISPKHPTGKLNENLIEMRRFLPSK